MAYSWSGLVTALRTAIGAAWPDVLPGAGGGGIWEVDQVGRLDFETILAGGMPFAIMEWAPIASGEWGVPNQVYETSLALSYVCRFSAAQGLTQVRTRLETLQDYLTTTGVGTVATVLEVTGFDWSAGHPANQLFLQANLPYVAGSLTAALVAGETAAGSLP